MEWTRSAFIGHWRLFAERPDLVTRGRYVFVPYGTPHLSSWHWLGSRDWATEDRDPWPSMGETDGPRQWTNGQSEVALPPAAVLGTAECLANGERWPLPVINRELIGGFDSRCWALQTYPPSAPFQVVPDIGDEDFAGNMALILDVMYASPNTAGTMLQTYLGPQATVTVFQPSGSLYPPTVIGTTPTYSVVLTSGTGNFQQLATQAFTSLQGPTNHGAYRTLPLWFNASSLVSLRATAAGVDPTRPVILIGDSYGGATSANLAARMRVADPNVDVRLLTFGMPPPGDGRMRDILSSVPQVHYANVGDPVPSLPPGLSDLLLFGSYIPDSIRDIWGEWTRPPVRRLLRIDGTYVEGPQLSDTYAVILSAALQAAATLPLPPYPQHEVKEYAIRLLLP